MLQGTAMRNCAPAARSAGRACPSLPARRLRLTVRANQNSGKVWGAEQENAAQVRRLISRDRKEFLGNEGDILDKYNVELGDAGRTATPPTPSPSAGPTISATTPNPFGSPAASANPFGSSPAPPASPFGSRQAIEPTGLRPDMSPDPFVKETPVNFIKSITLTQIVLFCSFTLIIVGTVATFNFVLGTGAIRIAGID
ncbi:hypothetical protein HYH03_012171 [Edaphochlamys debaryana]|uniref:Uncharacterized protein n=1 Tax=Edaphochlamys debaryana TaxID=47281 RepID=A0A836BUA3_9CHLO|nr:hypothetical protein HYH03_012171 [Edaphochlamys debaryana]|eukprot:KAG2489341.1 hypothetical protein HYH03_012171 [Edaphochlamys debaryana]